VTTLIDVNERIELETALDQRTPLVCARAGEGTADRTNDYPNVATTHQKCPLTWTASFC